MVHPLKDLLAKSRKALKHIELIEIAQRAESPSAAAKEAASNWPPRQVKAVRFLCMLRRDYPEAFTRLTTPTEHARPEEPGQSTLEE